MPRRLSPEKQFELERLERILRVMATFLDALMPAPFDASNTLTVVVERTAVAGNLRGMRMLMDDVIGAAMAATIEERLELDRRLRLSAATSLSALMERQTAQVTRLIARGRLTSEQQYYLVRDHLEFIIHDPAFTTEVPALERLLTEYEARIVASSNGDPRGEAV